MALDDRDYMRPPYRKRLSDYEPPVPRRPWWRKLTWQAILAGVVSVAGAVSATAWFLSDASYISDSVGGFMGPAEGSLVVNVNTATTAELEAVPGIGPGLAALIIANRRFESVDDLDRVKGIGPRTIESLRPFVKVEGDTEKL